MGHKAEITSNFGHFKLTGGKPGKSTLETRLEISMCQKVGRLGQGQYRVQLSFHIF